jgi:hypothetical protein
VSRTKFSQLGQFSQLVRFNELTKLTKLSKLTQPVVLLLLLAVFSHAACDVTLNSGANIATAVSNAASGSTLCLNTGIYPSFNATINKSAMTTITSAPGINASQATIASVDVGSSRNLTFQNVTIGGAGVGTSSTASQHIHFVGVKFTAPVCILCPSNIDQDTLIDSSSFAGVGQGCTEGRLGINGLDVNHTTPIGVTISHNVFGPGGCSDGIQLVGSANGAQILYNEFTGIKQGNCDPVHADPIQPYGADRLVITGNLFHGNSTGIMQAGCASQADIFTDNIFVSDGEYPDQIVMTGANGGTYNHNTFLNSGVRFGDPNRCGLVTNAVLTNNIFKGGGLNLTEGQGTGSFTLGFNNGIAGANAITGTPAFVGGSLPTTWSGFQLTAGSVGRNAGNDGKDVGTNFYGVVGATAPISNMFYVRDGGTSATCTDWTNACDSLPATLQRGATYYVADGAYGSYTFDDPESGGQLIVIKKATAGDHGTDTGWNAGYGDGQAVFNSVLTFTRGDYVLDGQVRDESNWFAGAAYGFQVTHNNQDQNIAIGTQTRAVNNVAIRYVYVNALLGNLGATTLRRYAIDTDTYGGPIQARLVFHRMFVNGSNNVWFLRTTNGAVVEYSASDNVTGNDANHGEIVNLYYSGTNATIRHNIFRNAYTGAGGVPAGGGTALVAITDADGLQFYGNTAYNFSVGDGAVGYLGGNASHCRLYNNTFVNGIGYNAGFASDGTDNISSNNLWVGNSAGVNISGSHDYNAFSDGSARGESHAQINVSTGIFVNYGTRDLRLALPTPAGTVLGVPYDRDPTGVSRGADGVWDRGAFEYVAGIGSPCDLNNDSATNVSDVQICANQAIGTAACGTGDINKDSACNVVDVQRTVNAALGGQCVTQ